MKESLLTSGMCSFSFFFVGKGPVAMEGPVSVLCNGGGRCVLNCVIESSELAPVDGVHGK